MCKEGVLVAADSNDIRRGLEAGVLAAVLSAKESFTTNTFISTVKGQRLSQTIVRRYVLDSLKVHSRFLLR